MRNKYIRHGGYFVIKNQNVARHALFGDKYYCHRFLLKFIEKLSPLCELLSYSLNDDEYILLVKMKSRKDFEEYHIRKKLTQGHIVFRIPISSDIFSQAMANFQCSTAMHFNCKEGRTGAVFARRFAKFHIKGTEELRKWFRDIREMRKIHHYGKKWKGGGERIRNVAMRMRWWYSSRCFTVVSGQVENIFMKLYKKLQASGSIPASSPVFNLFPP